MYGLNFADNERKELVLQPTWTTPKGPLTELAEDEFEKHQQYKDMKMYFSIEEFELTGKRHPSRRLTRHLTTRQLNISCHSTV